MAERQFRKVVEIVGESDELGQLASRSLEDLNQPGFANPVVAGSETVLVSLTSNGG